MRAIIKEVIKDGGGMEVGKSERELKQFLWMKLKDILGGY